MLTLSAQQLADAFARNTGVIHRHIDDLTHAESLVQPPYVHNCLNWVMGHIVQSRDQILQLFEVPALLTEAQTNRYKRGSQPVTQDGPDLIRLERLRNLLDEQQTQLANAFAHAPADYLQRPLGENTIGDIVFVLYFHETYHVGQVDPLRQVAGKNDRIIG